jgi:hypothetical protein
MSGFLGTLAGVIIDFTLLLQIVILVVLVVGYKFKMDKKLRKHGMTMSAAVILHVISILTIMIPSMLKYSDLLLIDISSTPVIVTWIHATIGLLAATLGMFLVIEWRFRPPPEMRCAKRKRLMKPLLILWILALLLGITVYIYAYVL